jgi:predicted nucleotide-binding protein
VAARRTMFVVSSARADPEVMKILKSTLATYDSHFEVVSWTDSQTGNILDNIWLKISSCTFAACYFSEPTHDPTSDARPSSRAKKQVKYRDNPNVLFEAGILYGLRQIGRSPLKKLLLVREENSPKIPFDLATEFMVMVPRLQNGHVNVSDLKTSVQNIVKAILED